MNHPTEFARNLPETDAVIFHSLHQAEKREPTMAYRSINDTADYKPEAPKQPQLPNAFGVMNDATELCNLIQMLAEKLVGPIVSETKHVDARTMLAPSDAPAMGTLNELDFCADQLRARINDARTAIQHIQNTL